MREGLARGRRETDRGIHTPYPSPELDSFRRCFQLLRMVFGGNAYLSRGAPGSSLQEWLFAVSGLARTAAATAGERCVQASLGPTEARFARRRQRERAHRNGWPRA